MRPQGKTKLGFFPLPVAEATRLKELFDLLCPEFSALDPCRGSSGICSFAPLKGLAVHRYGIEMDAPKGSPSWA